MLVCFCVLRVFCAYFFPLVVFIGDIFLSSKRTGGYVCLHGTALPESVPPRGFFVCAGAEHAVKRTPSAAWAKGGRRRGAGGGVEEGEAGREEKGRGGTGVKEGEGGREKDEGGGGGAHCRLCSTREKRE